MLLAKIQTGMSEATREELRRIDINIGALEATLRACKDERARLIERDSQRQFFAVDDTGSVVAAVEELLDIIEQRDAEDATEPVRDYESQ